MFWRVCAKGRERSKEYPTPRGTLKILSEISLTLSRGDAVSIMGPSGSGKSTLLYVLGALEPPTSGTVTLDGHNPFQLKQKELAAFRNKQIGFVFQIIVCYHSAPLLKTC